MYSPARIRDSGYSGHLRETAKAAEYYLGEEVPSEWRGKGAQIQGLSGEVKRADLERIMDGKIIDASGERELGRVSNGKREHLAGWDFTYGAPKSVSNEIALGNRDALEAARIANLAGIAVFEREVRARIEGKTVRTGNAIISTHEHIQNRNSQAHFHIHNFIANVTHSEKGRAYSVDYGVMLDGATRRKAMEVSRKTLEHELRRRGFETYRDAEGAPQLKGYTKEQIDRLSSRSGDVNEGLAARGKTRATATAAEKQAITYETRRSTNYTPELRRDAQERMRAESLAAGIKPAQKVSRSYSETFETSRKVQPQQKSREPEELTRATPAKARDNLAPTAKMLAKMEGMEARSVKAGGKPTLTDRERTDFQAARAWLDLHSEKIVGFQAGRGKEQAQTARGENGAERGTKANFKAAVDTLRDGELAARALKSASGVGFGLLKHELTASDKRSMERVYNSTGDRFYVDAKGNVYQDKLNASKNGQSKSLEGKGLLGEKEYVVLKNGTVLKRGGGIGGALQQKMARSLKSEGDGVLDRAWNKFVDRTVGDKWQRVTGLEASRVKAEIAREEKGARSEIRGRLESQIHQARQLMQERPELALAATQSIERNGYQLKGVQKAAGVSRSELADRAKAEGDAKKQPVAGQKQASPSQSKEVDRAYAQEARRLAIAERAAEIARQRDQQAAGKGKRKGRGKGKKLDGTVFRVIQPASADYSNGNQLSLSRDLRIRGGRSVSRDLRAVAYQDARLKTGMGRNLYDDHWNIAQKPVQIGQNMFDRVGDAAALFDKRYDAFGRMAGEAKSLWHGGSAWKALSRGADSGILRAFAMELQNDHERALEAASSVRGHQTRFAMTNSDSGYTTTRQMPGAGSLPDYSRMPSIPGAQFERVDAMAGVSAEQDASARRASADAVVGLLRAELGRAPERSSSASSSLSLDSSRQQEVSRGNEGMER